MAPFASTSQAFLDDRPEPGQSGVPGRGAATARLPASADAIASRVVRLMRRAEPDAADGGDADHAAVARASSSSGGALPDPIRGRFEQSLGADLGAVRVHTDDASATAAASVGAQAYAVGNDIHFAAGKYQPDDPFGLHLLAHEVAHTVQQSGGTPHRQHKLEVSAAGDASEVEADRAADAMVAGTAAQVGGGGTQLARKEGGGGAGAAVEVVKNLADAIKGWHDVYTTIIAPPGKGDTGGVRGFCSAADKVLIDRIARYHAGQKLCATLEMLAVAHDITLPLVGGRAAAPKGGKDDDAKSPLDQYVEQVRSIALDEIKDAAKSAMLKAVRRKHTSWSSVWDEDDSRGPIDGDSTWGKVELEIAGAELSGWAGLPEGLAKFGIIAEAEEAKAQWFEGGFATTAARPQRFDTLEVKFLKEQQAFSEEQGGRADLFFDFVWDSNTTQLQMGVTLDGGKPLVDPRYRNGPPNTGLL